MASKISHHIKFRTPGPSPPYLGPSPKFCQFSFLVAWWLPFCGVAHPSPMVFTISPFTWKLLKVKVFLFSVFPFRVPSFMMGLIVILDDWQQWLITTINFEPFFATSKFTVIINKTNQRLNWNILKLPRFAFDFLTLTVLLSPTVTFISGASSDWLAIPDKAISSFDRLSFPPVSVHQNIF